MARRKSRRFVFVAATLVGLLVLAVGGYTVLARPAVVIDASRLATVEGGDLARSVVATGKIEPVSKVEIKSKANGIIKELRVQVGDQVSEGQVLAELDRVNLEAQLRESEAALSGADASFNAAEAELAKNRIEAEGPDVPFARRNLQRAEELMKDQIIAPQALDDTRSALDLALNRQKAAQSQLGVSAARVAQAQAAVAQARASRDRAQEELSNTTIRSPIRGIVLSRDIEIGSPVSSILNLGANATLVMVLGDISQVYVRGKVDEADIGTVHLTQPARIRVETFKDHLFEGRVTQIAPMGVERDNVVTFEVRVSIDNATGVLKANMTANAEIVLEEHKGTLLIPESAVIYDAQHHTFAELASARAKTGKERVPIKVGISNGTRTEVLNGLSQGQKVIVQ